MTSRPPYWGGRGWRSFSGLESHFESVHDANLGFRHDNRGSPSNIDPRQFNHGNPIENLSLRYICFWCMRSGGCAKLLRLILLLLLITKQRTREPTKVTISRHLI